MGSVRPKVRNLMDNLEASTTSSPKPAPELDLRNIVTDQKRKREDPMHTNDRYGQVPRQSPRQIIVGPAQQHPTSAKISIYRGKGLENNSNENAATREETTQLGVWGVLFDTQRPNGVSGDASVQDLFRPVCYQ